MKISIFSFARTKNLLRGFLSNPGAASAVEFSLLVAPFFYMVMAVLQVGIMYMAQSALDTGVIKTAETLRTNFTTATIATLLNAGQLKAAVASNAGALINNDGTLAVEIRQLSNLSSSMVPIADGTVDYGSSTSTLVVRAQSSVVSFTPGLGGLNTIYSTALVRRQGT